MEDKLTLCIIPSLARFSPCLRGEILIFNYTITKLLIYPIFFDFSHALAYFQLTYAAWFISTSRPSRPSRKPPRKKYAQTNRTIGRKTIFTTLKPTLRSRATMSAPSDEYRLACSIKLSSVG